MEQTVRLLGDLGERYGAKHVYYDLRTPADAIKLLCINKPAFQEELIHAHENGVGYQLIQAGTDLDYADLKLPLGSNDLILTPVITGSGGSTGSILAGVGLVALAIVIGPAAGGFLGLGAGLGGATGAGAAISMGLVSGAAATAIGAIGASLILGGVAQMLSPQPTIPNLSGSGIRGSGESGSTDGPQSVTRGANGRQSYSFTGAANTVGVGATIPVAYGKVLIGSHLLSARTYASGFRFRKWTPHIVKFKLQTFDGPARTTPGFEAVNRRQTLSLNQGNAVALTDVDYKEDNRRNNYMMFFSLPNGLFDFVSGPGTTKVDGFITFQVDLIQSLEADIPDPDVGSFQVTIQGLLLPNQTYRWMQYIEYPLFSDDLGPTFIATKVTIIDFRCHSSCKLRMEHNGYDVFRKNAYNTAALEA